MKNYLELTKEIQEHDQPHHNCAQVILCTFSEEMGMDYDQAFAMGTHFGAGMRCGGTCGAITGGLMVLGGLDHSSLKAKQLMMNFQENHGCTDCKTLLQKSREGDGNPKHHCRDLVREMVSNLETMICEEG
ncbi:MAG: C-GCAxxG-C-C family protein [Eubacteriales bacterium]